MSTIQPMQPKAVPICYVSLCSFSGLVEHLMAAYSLDVNSRGGFYMTLLHVALAKEHARVTSLLVKHGADPNCQDNLGRVPLH
jgi:ankyrin repeat protein